MKILVMIDTEDRENVLGDDDQDILDSLQDVEDSIRDIYDGIDGEDVDLIIQYDEKIYKNGELK
jgi:hypothetical protein